MAGRTEIATLAGGCFWCLEAAFERLEGVRRVVSGYTGGHAPGPSYSQVCSGASGHAEAVQVAFDPEVLSFRQLLEAFFSIHDPTTLNCQGADIGTQYRSAIFYHTPEQRAEAERVIAELDASGTLASPVVTEIRPLTVFYPAEDYHQQYYRNNPDQPYCQMVIAPKLAKFSRGH